MKRMLAIIIGFSVAVIACKDKSEENVNATQHNSQIEILNKQIAANPDSAGLRLKLIDLYDSIGNYKQAFTEIDSLIRKDSGNYGFWFRRGNLAESARDTQTALSSYTVAAKIYPSPEILLSLANLYAEQKNPRSLLLVNEVQKLSLGRETDAHCFFIAGVYHSRTKNRTLATQLFDKCIANNYTYMEAYIEKGLVYFDAGDYREALKVFSFASGVNNLYADAYYYMARCYEMMNIKDSAELRFKQSLTLDKNLQEARDGLKRLGAD
jgi:tetratricopeptide (TPR) repeat protein